MGKKITFKEAVLTSIGMLIGSGIFFRADNILGATEGNVSVAVTAWIVLGSAIAIAGIGMSVLAEHLDVEGGMAGYIEACFGKTAGFLVGWFSTLAYIPPLTGILGIVASTYTLQLFGVANPSVILLHSLAAFLIIITYTWNYFSTKFAALFSSAATIIKLLPIIIVGLIGMINVDTGLLTEGFSTFELGLFTAPLLSIAFAFDGWTNICTLSKDMENPQKDTARSLVLTAAIVTVAYVLYFTGVTMLLPVNEIISLGDEHVGVIAQKILGDIGGKFILFCVIVSVLGTLNGNVMTGYRYPHALAQAKDLPNSDFFVQESKHGTTGRAAMITFGAVVAWFIMYTVQALSKAARALQVENDAALSALAEDKKTEALNQHLLSGIAFDDIPIMAVSMVIILCLIGAILVGKKHNVGMFKGMIAPIIGIISQVYIIFSFMQNNTAWLTYMIIVAAIVLVGFLIRSQLPHVKNKTA